MLKSEFQAAMNKLSWDTKNNLHVATGGRHSYTPLAGCHSEASVLLHETCIKQAKVLYFTSP